MPVAIGAVNKCPFCAHEWMYVHGKRSRRCPKCKASILGPNQSGTSSFLTLMQAQNGKCAICKEQLKIEGNKRKRIHQDHCHNTGRDRGLLCVRCNLMIGFAKDDIVVLQAAIDYLGFHASRPVEEKPKDEPCFVCGGAGQVTVTVEMSERWGNDRTGEVLECVVCNRTGRLAVL